MRLICTRCGEPWHLDKVLHDKLGRFERSGGRIDRCPACPPRDPVHPPRKQMQLDAIRVLADRLGDDAVRLALALERARLVWLDNPSPKRESGQLRREET